MIYPNRPERCLLILVAIALITLVISGMTACSSKKVKHEEPPGPEESIAKAEALIEDDKYEEARQLLSEVRSSDVTRKYAPIAQLKIAESYEKDDNPEAALNEYRRYLEQYPDGTYAPYAQFQIAMIYFSQIKGPDRGAGHAKAALNEFRNLQKKYPRNPYKEVVAVNIEKCLNTIADYELLVGKFYFKKRAYKAALARLLGVEKEFPGFRSSDEVVYYLALTYDRLGDKENRSKYFEKMREEHPDSELLKELEKEIPGR